MDGIFKIPLHSTVKSFLAIVTDRKSDKAPTQKMAQDRRDKSQRNALNAPRLTGTQLGGFCGNTEMRGVDFRWLNSMGKNPESNVINS